jgi:secondary thiamine-phosphate synthase enzyme
MTLHTHGRSDVHDITREVAETIRSSQIRNGLATIFIPGSTAGVTTMEYESGVIEDFKAAIERLAPEQMHYAHNARWGDGNGYSHVRAALLGPSITVPVREGDPALGTWQQIVLVDFDNRPRNREIMITLIGE